MEDLDPEPAPPARRGLRLEWLLGGLLVLGVLGFAGWDWWRQERQEGAYAAGQRAAAALDWEAARAAFAAAGDFRDAPERAQDAAATIAERDRQHAAAQDALNRNDPLRALAALRAVHQMQPGYGDTPRLIDLVTPQVYGAALGGTVALRPKADPPGLYTYQPAGVARPGGWQWLPHSDRASRVRAGDRAGTVIYDGTAGEDGAGRALWQAALGRGPLRPRRLAVDPAVFNEFRLGPGGVWAIGAGSDRPFAAESVQGYSPLRVAHQAPGSDHATSLSWLPSRWVVLDLDHHGPRYLLADMARAFGDDPQTILHMSDINNNVLYPLYTARGLVLHARFSPDGRYVLLLTSRDAGRGEEIYELVLIDRQAGNQARVLQTRSINRRIPLYSDLSRPLDATFLTGEFRAGQVVMLTQDGVNSVLSLIYPGLPTAAPEVLWTQPSVPGLKIAVVESPHDAGLSVLWFDRMGADDTSRCIYIDDRNHALPLKRADELVFAGWVAAGHLLTVGVPVREEPGSPGPRLYVRSLAPGELRKGSNRFDSARRPVPLDLSPAALLYQLDPPDGMRLPLNFGPTFNAGVQGGALHARTYDGAVDLLLEPDVAWLYVPGTALEPEGFHMLP
jgi:hypothetical protein